MSTVRIQDAIASSPVSLSPDNQIPFLFSAIPYQLIDSEVFGDLKGSHIKLILAIDRFRNLKLKQRKSDQVLLSGWTISISQQVLADKCKLQRPTVNKLVEELIDLGLLEKELVGRSKKYRYRLTFYDVTSKQVWEMQSNGIQDEEIHRMKQEIEELKQQIDDVVEVEQDPSDDTCRENEQTCVENSDRHIKDNLKDINITSSSTSNLKSENQQQLEFDQGTSGSSVTSQNDSYDDDIRELTEYWYLHKKARCYGSHHQYRLHNFKGCVQDLIDHYQFDRQKSIEILKTCIELHSDTPDTPNWYIKHHKGLEYLNMAISRVVKNTSVPVIDNESSRRIQEYLRTYIQPLHKAGKVFTEKSILDRIEARLGRDLELMGEDAVLDLIEQVLGNIGGNRA
jgi:DNA-binding Lrp family transcriptional regulator|tara:strand:- start:191 stop:1381 length:1191 start_codon:yes stop_codon:yes gene_type:complete